MKKSILTIAFAAVMLLSMCFVDGASMAAAEGVSDEAVQDKIADVPEDAEYKDDQVLVVFNDEVSDKTAEKVAESRSGELEETADLGSGSDEQTMAVVSTEEGSSVQESMQDLAKDSRVEYVQPNYIYRLSGSNTNDSQQASLWQFDAMDIRDAWDLVDQHKNTSGRKVRVAVLDSGIDVNNEDLQVNVNKSLNADATTDKITVGEDKAKSLDPHGTHVAGIIGATSGNGKGVAGVAAGNHNDLIEMFSVLVFKKDDFSGIAAYSSDITKGVDYASKNGAKVINMSLGGEYLPKDRDDQLLKQSVQNAVAKGATVVCAAGNDMTNCKEAPAMFSSCISVANCNQRWRTNETSTYGTTVDLAAPGVLIKSTYPGNKYVKEIGTSMSAPMVSGTAALLYAINPNLTSSQVKRYLYRTATDMYSSGRDIYSGYGCVNAFHAVNYLASGSAVRDSHLSSGMRVSSTTYNSAKLKWASVSGLSKYKVQRKIASWDYRNGQYKTIATTGNRSYRVKKLKCGKSYEFRIIAKNGYYYGSIVGTVKVKVVPARTTAVAHTKVFRRIQVSWKKVGGATGYAIYRKAGLNGKYKKRRMVGISTRRWTDSGLRKGKTYYYKVRAYRKVGKKRVYGAASNEVYRKAR
ncbi:MAG: S8 family serine peptidase [Anaerovoracaceae bacterium]